MADQDRDVKSCEEEPEQGKEKSIHKNFRITKKQDIYLQESSVRYGIGESEFLRRLLEADMGNASQMQTQEEFLARKRLVYEINRIGNNINQIVKNVNSHYYSDYEKKKLFAMMKKVEELLSGGEKGEENNA